MIAARSELEGAALSRCESLPLCMAGIAQLLERYDYPESVLLDAIADLLMVDELAGQVWSRLDEAARSKAHQMLAAEAVEGPCAEPPTETV